MKKTEYFKRAATDAAFRKAQIEEKRDVGLAKVLFWFFGAPAIVFFLYCAFTAKLDAATLQQALFMAVLTTWIYDSHKTTLAALEAMEDSNPSPASAEIHAASPQR